MATRLAPDGIVASTNLTGAVGAIQEDPATPDTSWLTRTSANTATDLRVSFPTPSTNPTGTQTFRVLVRSTGEATAATCTVQVYENGTLRATAVAATAVTSTAGVVLSGTWDASVLTDPTGAGVECRALTTVGGGKPASRATLEYGAVAWDATLVIPPGKGTGGGGFNFTTASRTGKRVPKGSKVGAVGFAGSSSGVTSRRGSSGGTATFTASAATGSQPKRGTATGGFSLTGSAPGKRNPKATAAGSSSFTGSADGRVVRRLGSASGTAQWAGTASAKTVRRGATSGTTGWASSAVGRVIKHGTAAGTTAWTASLSRNAIRRPRGSIVVAPFAVVAVEAPTRVVVASKHGLRAVAVESLARTVAVEAPAGRFVRATRPDFAVAAESPARSVTAHSDTYDA